MYLLNLFEKTVIIWKKLKQGEIMELNSDKISQNYQSILASLYSEGLLTSINKSFLPFFIFSVNFS